MGRLGQIVKLVCDSDGQVLLECNPKISTLKMETEILSLSSIALITNLFASLSNRNVSILTSKIIQGVINNNFTKTPMRSIIQSVAIEFYAEKNLAYTLIKPKVKLFSNNFDIEQEMIQIELNTISKAFENNIENYNEPLRTALYGIISILEFLLREAVEQKLSSLEGRASFTNTGILFINKFPQNFRDPGLLAKYIAETNPHDLIQRLYNLPGPPDKPLLSR